MLPFKFVRESITLRDGRTVTVRPMGKDDAERILDLHNSLSFDSQYYRFFGPKPRLTEAEAAYLADVDFSKRFAIAAEVTEDDRKRLVGVGRFDVQDDNTAEAAIVIRDDYQGMGLGTALLERMREVGRGAGIEAFVAEILAENNRMLDLLKKNGLEIEPSESGVIRVRAPIDRPVLLRGLRIVAGLSGVPGAIIGRLGGSADRDDDEGGEER